MENCLNPKLIAVINSVQLMLCEAQGLKVSTNFQEFPLVIEKHRHHNKIKRDSHFQKKSVSSSLFEPHSISTNIEYQEAAREAAGILEKKVQNKPGYYKQLIIVAEPKMLGYLRQLVSNHLKQIIQKEIPKNLVGQDKKIIEKAIFA